jgi:aryl-alcohol dehydrogenase-like predicted oxidoreductase
MISHRRLGRTNLSVSALGLGAVELGLDYGIPAPGHFGRPQSADAVRLVHSALEAGINYVDTARAYGASEDVLGIALKGRRDHVVLATKAATPGDGLARLSDAELTQHLQASLDASLRALKTDYVDLWQIHNVDAAALDRIGAVAAAFDSARQAGKVRWVGGSFYGAELPVRALTLHLFDVMQVTYSVLDQRLADEFLAAAARHDVGVVVRSVLLKGVLTERAEHLPANLEVLRRRSRAYRARVHAAQVAATPAQVAVAFALAHPGIHSVLVGVRTEDELRENLVAAALTLPPALFADLLTMRLDDTDLLNPATWGIP